MDKLKQKGDRVLQDVVQNLYTAKEDLDAILEKVFDCQDEINRVSEEMGECKLPSNIDKRRNEISQLDDRIEIMRKEFRDLK